MKSVSRIAVSAALQQEHVSPALPTLALLIPCLLAGIWLLIR